MAVCSDRENVLALSARASNDLEIESCYLIGDFGVWTEDGMHFEIGEEKETVEAGDLRRQGYPFFAGTVALSQTVELSDESVHRACVVFDGLNAIVTEVEVNRGEAGKITWHPHRAEIGGRLREGTNEIRVTLTGSLRNLLGPHHHRDGELLSVEPFSFKDEAHWTDVYQFVPFGFESAKIVVGE